MNNISSVIESEVEKWKNSLVNPPVNDASDINNGHCKPFARDIKRKIGDNVQIHSWGFDTNGYNSYAHSWIEYDGRHYDAECSQGVEHPSELPIFQRAEIDPTEDE